MHANTWILDHLLIAYGPICKFVAEVAYFVDFGGCFSVSRHFFHLSSYQSLSQLWKKEKTQPRPFATTRVSSITTPLHKCRFSGTANPRAALNHTFVKMFHLKTKIFPLVIFFFLSCLRFFSSTVLQKGAPILKQTVGTKEKLSSAQEEITLSPPPS